MRLSDLQTSCLLSSSVIPSSTIVQYKILLPCKVVFRFTCFPSLSLVLLFSHILCNCATFVFSLFSHIGLLQSSKTHFERFQFAFLLVLCNYFVPERIILCSKYYIKLPLLYKSILKNISWIFLGMLILSFARGNRRLIKEFRAQLSWDTP